MCVVCVFFGSFPKAKDFDDMPWIETQNTNKT